MYLGGIIICIFFCVRFYFSFYVFVLYSVYDFIINKLCGRPPQYAPAPCKLTF